MTSWITICDTCRRADRPQGDGAAETDGAVFAALVEAAAAGRAGLATRRISCLMGCSRACNVTVQAAGKMAYSLGEFAPDPAAAAALVDWAALHAASDGGIVPYRQWPAGVKGHFVSRHPALPEEA
jgi:predicted metal-binding protein